MTSSIEVKRHMAAPPTWIPYGPAEVILLHHLYDPDCERDLGHRHNGGSWREAQESHIVPLQIGPASIEFWSDGTWEWFLSTKTSSSSFEPTDGHRANDHRRITA